MWPGSNLEETPVQREGYLQKNWPEVFKNVKAIKAREGRILKEAKGGPLGLQDMQQWGNLGGPDGGVGAVPSTDMLIWMNAVWFRGRRALFQEIHTEALTGDSSRSGADSQMAQKCALPTVL